MNKAIQRIYIAAIIKGERMEILMNIRDEDLACAHMPELRKKNFVLKTRVGIALSRCGCVSSSILRLTGAYQHEHNDFGRSSGADLSFQLKSKSNSSLRAKPPP